MKKSIVLILSLLFTLLAYSQEIQYEDVVYLKNGSIIHGMIIEQIPNQTIKIKTADGNLFVFEYTQIEKITKEEVPQEYQPKEQKAAPASPYVGKENGFEGTVDLLFAVQLEWGEPVLGMHFIGGYRFIPQLYLGAGTGVEIYSEETMLPLFVQVRTDFVKAKVTPFFYANVGYAFGWINGEEGSDWGGVFMEPGIGFRFNIAEHFGLNISSSFKFQRAYYADYYYAPYYSQNYHDARIQETYRLFTFKVGFSF
ncbi:MAG: hypothetical protein DRJ15_00545 [Bacteroidetes bacterium]|nr:MAG: hypothetical protein DRI83_08500 [Bacteroidota bacterium]RLD82764.1 MAG: hypothetical protein DRJ15_00545 [Bacteroidota bacterium]